MVYVQAKGKTLLERKNIINKIKLERFLVYFVFFFTLVMESVIFTSALSFVRFLNDVAVVLMLILSLRRIVKTFKKLKCTPVLCCILAFIVTSIFSAIINLTPINMFVWGARNTFRGMVFFISCVCYLDGVDLSKIFKILFYVQLVNFLSCIIQFAFLGRKGDAMGGLFGPTNNAALGALNAIVYVYFFIAYVRRKESFVKTAIMFSTSIVMTAIAEEKFGLLFCLLSLIVTMFVKGDGKKKFYLFISVLLAFVLGIIVLGAIFPESLAVIKSLNGWLTYSQTTYEEGYMIPRVGGISYISEHFFKGDPLKILFGYGLGNCDTSQVSFFQSDFYTIYGNYNYRWFSNQWIYLEGGLVGLCSFISIFVACFICLLKQFKRLSKNCSVYCSASMIMLIYACLSLWVSSIIKIDYSYLLYFSFAVGVISLKPVALTKKREDTK